MSNENLREAVAETIAKVENAVEDLQNLRKTILQKSFETKQSILISFLNQRNSIHSREVSLMGQVDKLLLSKDDALVTQLSKLNQVLGCLRNCLELDHPCGDCLEKYEDLDLTPIDEIDTEFTAANEDIKKELFFTLEKPAAVSSPGTINAIQSIAEWLIMPMTSDKQVNKPYELSQKTAEWLLGDNTNLALRTGSLFTHIKEDQVQKWLLPDNSQSMPLCHSVFKQFSSGQSLPGPEWLVKKKEEAKWLWRSENTKSSAGSSASFLACDSSNNTIESFSKNQVVPSHWLKSISEGTSQSHYDIVSDWLESCKLVNDDGWLLRQRKRFDSISSWSHIQEDDDDISSKKSSFTALKHTPIMHDWLIKKQVLKQLVSTSEENPDLKAEMEVFIEEKHDVSLEKEDVCDWLVPKGVNELDLHMQIENYKWMVDSKKQSRPSSMCSGKVKSHNWLYQGKVCNEFINKELSYWIADESNKTAVDHGNAFKSDLSQWLK